MPLICPACGQTNADHAHICSYCSFALQGFTFQQAGFRVQILADLPTACDRAWIEAIGYLTTGKFDQWLNTLGPTGQAWIGALQAVRDRYPQDPHLQLDAFLRQIDTQRPLPQLHVQPVQTPLAPIEQGVAHKSAITIGNSGGGILVGTIHVAESWITIQPNIMQLSAGKSEIFTAQIDTMRLKSSRKGMLHAAQVNIHTNGGDHSVTFQVQVITKSKLIDSPKSTPDLRQKRRPSTKLEIEVDGFTLNTTIRTIDFNELWPGKQRWKAIEMFSLESIPISVVGVSVPTWVKIHPNNVTIIPPKDTRIVVCVNSFGLQPGYTYEGMIGFGIPTETTNIESYIKTYMNISVYVDAPSPMQRIVRVLISVLIGIMIGFLATLPYHAFLSVYSPHWLASALTISGVAFGAGFLILTKKLQDVLDYAQIVLKMGILWFLVGGALSATICFCLTHQFGFSEVVWQISSFVLLIGWLVCLIYLYLRPEVWEA